jgi:hypothetical protein
MGMEATPSFQLFAIDYLVSLTVYYFILFFKRGIDINFIYVRFVLILNFNHKINNLKKEYH